jgi:cytochrome P450
VTAPRWSDEHDGHWVAESYEAIRAVAGNDEAFSSAHSVHVPTTGLYDRGIRIFALEHDGDEHRGQRQLLMAATGTRPSTVPRDLVASCLEPLLDGIDWSRPVDLVAALTNPLPLDVIFALIGGDDEFKPEMKRLVDALIHRVTWTEDLGDPAERIYDIAASMVDRRRAEPREDWITGLAEASVCGKPLTREEQVAAVVSLITGGHHSTSRGLGSLFARVVSEPGLRDRLIENRSLVNAAIDETLRLHTPLPEFSRTAARPADVCGAAVQVGQQVSMRYDRGNRDPEIFEAPDEFRLDRRGGQHLAFGFGPHSCAGTNLARAEMQMALSAVLERAPGLRLLEEIVWLGPAEPQELWVSA